MTTMRGGFTLIELMIVIAIIAIIASIAIPNLLESRLSANESATAASLKSGIFPAEVLWQGGGYQDSDSDNVGEYGTIAYLAGNAGFTGTSGATGLRLITGPLAINQGGTRRRAQGYFYLPMVPGPTGGVGVISGNALLPASGVMTANDAEMFWVVGAAPEKYGETGRRCFLINQEGVVRTPTLNALVITAGWMGSPLALNPAPTAASMANGINAGYATPNDLSSTFNTARYGVYVR